MVDENDDRCHGTRIAVLEQRASSTDKQIIEQRDCINSMNTKIDLLRDTIIFKFDLTIGAIAANRERTDEDMTSLRDDITKKFNGVTRDDTKEQVRTAKESAEKWSKWFYTLIGALLSIILVLVGLLLK